MELQEQIKAYTAWVNSQLKKKSLRITDFENDLKDGTMLTKIVEIVCGHHINSVKPETDQEKKQNVSKVIDFMKSRGIKLHHITTEEIVTGNVKSTMQLILALAAHFKPASIGGKKETIYTPSSEEKVTQKVVEHKNGLDFSKEMNEIQDLALELQKILLLESEGRQICGMNFEEDLIIARAELNILLEEKQRQEKELIGVRQNLKDFVTSNSALKVRLKQQEDELSFLRQKLLHSNLARDKLKSEKAELFVELDDTKTQFEELRNQSRNIDLKCKQLENDFVQAQTEHIRAISRKDREIKDLQRQHSPGLKLADSVFHEPNLRLSPKRSSGLSRGSPTLSRKSPVSRTNPPRRRKVSENTQTRILYFTDRDMTPAMATISKSVGDITLGEFKSAIKKQGDFRYIFKALDPELGTVKEEIFHDDDVIPGWEGKIVAWVEEELHV